jgi:2-polyprenyl-3-methyl-5-hydroxy-6-metoxy-1,4-benzoquinol methylase
MGTLDSREYDRLKDRNFRDYSEGHRHMYLSAIDQIGAEDRSVSIFEAGFGIGYGLKQMLAADIVGRYVGCEPQVDSYNYTVKEMAEEALAERLTLVHAPFGEDMVDAYKGEFSHAFCIEVIEHVPLELHADFIGRLAAMLAPSGTLWLSTPCSKRNAREGVRTTEEWEAMLRHQFGEVTVDRSRWTYLYRCR